MTIVWHWRVDAKLEAERFSRAADFDLESFWSSWRDRQEASRPTFDVRLRVRADAVEHVNDVFGPRRGVFYGVPQPSEDWVTMDVSFSSLGEARRAILNFGGAVEVLSPEPLRCTIIDFAEQIRARYPS